MHIFNALGIAGNFYAEGLHNIIVDVLQIVLVDSPVLSPHSFPQLKPYLPLKVVALIHSQVRMSIIPFGFRLVSSLEIICGYPFQIAEVPLISRKFLFRTWVPSSTACILVERLYTF